MTHKLGRDLQVGDVIGVWWSPGRDQITSLRLYNGPLKNLWAPDVARLADFALSKTGMTIEPHMQYEVMNEA